MDDKKVIGARIRARRLELDIKQVDLARDVGMKNQTTLWRAEEGRTLPGTSTLILLAKRLGMTFDDLTDRSGAGEQLPPETADEKETLDRVLEPGATARERRSVLRAMREAQALKAAKSAAPQNRTSPGSSRPPESPTKRGRRARSA